MAISTAILEKGEICGVQFKEDGPKFPELMKTDRVAFREGGFLVDEGFFGIIDRFWDRKGIVKFYPIALEIGKKLFTLETNIFEIKRERHVKSYFLCYFNNEKNTHHNLGIKISGENLSQKLLHFVINHMKTLGIFKNCVTVLVESNIFEPTRPRCKKSKETIGSEGGSKKEQEVIQPCRSNNNEEVSKKLWPGIGGWQLKLPTIKAAIKQSGNTTRKRKSVHFSTEMVCQKRRPY